MLRLLHHRISIDGLELNMRTTVTMTMSYMKKPLSLLILQWKMPISFGKQSRRVQAAKRLGGSMPDSADIPRRREQSLP
jgi:hypothetical protein